MNSNEIPSNSSYTVVVQETPNSSTLKSDGETEASGSNSSGTLRLRLQKTTNANPNNNQARLARRVSLNLIYKY